MDKILRYKWLYLWIAAAGVLTLGLFMIFNQEFGQSIVLILTAIILIISVIIRIVPLIKTLRGGLAKLLNIIALVLDLGAGIVITLIVINNKQNEYNMVFPFLIGGVLYFQGLIYLIETTFLGTKGEPIKFLIHVALLTLGTIVMARYDTFTTEYFRWVIGIAFLLCFVFSTIDGIYHYNKYRKKYILPKKTEKAAANVNWAETATITDNKKEKELALAVGAEKDDIPKDSKEELPNDKNNDEDTPEDTEEDK